MTLDKLLTQLVTADNRMTTVSHLCINTGASDLAMHFKLSDWISLTNRTHFSLRHMSSILTVLFLLGLKLKLTP